LETKQAFLTPEQWRIFLWSLRTKSVRGYSHKVRGQFTWVLTPSIYRIRRHADELLKVCFGLKFAPLTAPENPLSVVPDSFRWAGEYPIQLTPEQCRDIGVKLYSKAHWLIQNGYAENGWGELANLVGERLKIIADKHATKSENLTFNCKYSDRTFD